MSTTDKIYLSVEIPVASGEFPNSDELKARNAIIDQLDKRRIGKFIGAGGGMGMTDFSYVVDDEPRARREIAEAVQKFWPQAQYTVEQSAADDIDLSDDEGGSEEEDISWPKAIGCLSAMGIGIALIIWLIWKAVT